MMSSRALSMSARIAAAARSPSPSRSASTQATWSGKRFSPGTYSGRPSVSVGAHRTQALGARVALAALEDRREVVRDDDHAGGLAKIACAAATPAPASLR